MWACLILFKKASLMLKIKKGWYKNVFNQNPVINKFIKVIYFFFQDLYC